MGWGRKPAYYAMFHGALALLLIRDLSTSKHTGVLALIDREFIRPGLIPAEMGMKLRDAFNQRQKSDYSELVPTSEDRAKVKAAGKHDDQGY